MHLLAPLVNDKEGRFPEEVYEDGISFGFCSVSPYFGGSCALSYFGLVRSVLFWARALCPILGSCALSDRPLWRGPLRC